MGDPKLNQLDGRRKVGFIIIDWGMGWDGMRWDVGEHAYQAVASSSAFSDSRNCNRFRFR